MTRVIGLAGGKGVGKSSIARAIKAHDSDRVKIFSFAAPIKSMLKAMGIPAENLENPELKEEPVEWLGATPRHMMQTLGTEWGRNMVRGDIWLQVMRSRIENESDDAVIVIDDVRFENERDLIRDIGGTCFLLKREGFGFSTEHSSESGKFSCDAQVDASDIQGAAMAIIQAAI